MSLYPNLNEDVPGELSHPAAPPPTPFDPSAPPTSQPSQSGPSKSPPRPPSQSMPLSGAAPVNDPHDVRMITLSTDAGGKFGAKVVMFENELFVSLVEKNSSAFNSGLQFGDNIIEVDGKEVDKKNVKKLMKSVSKHPKGRINFVVRNNPFERLVVVPRNSSGKWAIKIYKGKIIDAKNSNIRTSDHLVDSHIVKLNGQCVLGMKDDEITQLMDANLEKVELAVVPESFYLKIKKTMMEKDFRDNLICDD